MTTPGDPSEGALHASTRALRSLMSANIGGVIVADLHGAITDANDAFLELVGYSRDELRAGEVRWDRLTPPEYAAEAAGAIAALQASGTCPAYEKVYLHKSGRRVPVLVGFSMFNGTLDRCIGFVVDLTARQRAEAEGARLQRQADELALVARHLTDTLDLEEVAERVVNSVLAIFGAQSAILRRLRPDGVLVSIGIAGRRLEGLDVGYLLPAGVGLVGRAIAERRAVWSEDIARDRSLDLPEDFRRKLANAGQRAVLAVPLAVKGEVLGALSIAHAEVRRFSEPEATLLQTFADQAALAIRNVELFAQQETARREAEEGHRRTALLAQASALLATSLDDELTLKTLARLAIPTLADWCAVDLVSDEGIKRIAVVHADPAKGKLASEWFERHPIPRNAMYGVPRVARTGRSELYESVPDRLLERMAETPEELEFLRSLRLQSFLFVPLKARERTFGVITFVTAESGRRYSRADVATAEELAHHAGLAIENARLYREARESARQKDQFLAMLAHELRNPLAPIANAVHMLGRIGDAEPRTVRLLDLISRQTAHLARLVDDLLDVSRIRLGKVALARAPVDLRETARRSLDSLHAAGKTTGHSIGLSLGADPVMVDGDAMRLEQIVGNILDNAVKYTPPGGAIRLTVNTERGVALVQVEDEGIGIVSEDLARVFDVFVQADNSLDRTRGGLGLGLSLVRALVEQHGGSVTAECPGLGHGTTLTVRLPLSTATASSPRAHEAVGAVTRRVLLIEDNADAREALLLVLELDGHRVQVAADGPRGLEVAARSAPEVVLVDIGLPGMDGYEVARRLRAAPLGKVLRLIALTGYGQPEDRQRAAEAGFDEHLVKPVAPADLARAIGSVP